MTLFGLKTSTDVSERSPLTRLNMAEFFLLCLMFLFFTTSCGDLLYAFIYIFKPKIGHLVAVFLLGWFLFLYARLQIPKLIGLSFLALLASLGISAVLSVYPGRCLGYVVIYCFNFLVYFLLPFNLVQRLQTSTVLRCYFLSFLVLGFYAVLQVFLSYFYIFEPFVTQTVGRIARGQAWTYEPSFYALYITPFVMYKNAMAIFRPEEKLSRREKIKLLGLNGLLLVSTSTGIVFSYPMFALICSGLSFLYYVRPYVEKTKRRLVRLLIAFFGSIGVLSLFLGEIIINSFYKFFYAGFTHHSFLDRLQGLIRTVGVFLEHPFFGVGIGGIGPYIFKKTWPFDAAPTTLKEFEGYDPTNNFTEILASIGIVGLMGILFLSWVFYRLFRSVFKDPLIDPEDKRMVLALFASLLIQIFVLQYNQGLFRPYIWIHAAIVYGVMYKMKRTTSFSS
jgi:O-antigen ligase